MADLQFTWREFEALTKRLSSVASDLTEPEWDLLLAIFAVAADQAGSNPAKTKGTLPAADVNQDLDKIKSPKGRTAAELQAQLHHAYVPGPPPAPSWIFRVTPPQIPTEGELQSV